MQEVNALLGLSIILLLLVSFTGLEQTVRSAEWTYVTDTPFTGGYGECVAWDGNYMYVLRQYNANHPAYFYRYDPNTGQWEDLSSSLPDVDFKNGLAMAFDGQSSFYVLAGSAYADGPERVYFYRYDIEENVWIRLNDTPHVQGAGDAIVYSHFDNKVYAFLGRAHYTGSYQPENYSVFTRYDPENDSWELLPFPDWPGTDDGASLVWAGGNFIYALEGEFYETTPVRAFACFDIVNGTWEELSDIPAEGGVGDGGSLIWIGNYLENLKDVIFAIPGNDCLENPGYSFFMYCISNDTWVRLEDLPYPVGYYVGNRLAYYNGFLYYWQGAPGTWEGGGKRICKYPLSSIPEIPLP